MKEKPFDLFSPLTNCYMSIEKAYACLSFLMEELLLVDESLSKDVSKLRKSLYFIKLHVKKLKDEEKK